MTIGVDMNDIKRSFREHWQEAGPNRCELTQPGDGFEAKDLNAFDNAMLLVQVTVGRPRQV